MTLIAIKMDDAAIAIELGFNTASGMTLIAIRGVLAVGAAVGGFNTASGMTLIAIPWLGSPEPRGLKTGK